MEKSKRVNWSALRDAAEEKFVDCFPERQIYFRSKGVVRFVSLSPRFQVSAISSAFIVTCWLGIASASLIFGNELIEQKEQQISDLRDIRADLHGQLVELEAEILNRAQALQTRQQIIDEMLNRSNTLFGETGAVVDETEKAENAPKGTKLPVGGPDTSVEGGASTSESEEDAKANKDLSDKVSRLERVQEDLIVRLTSEMGGTSERIEKALTAAGLKLADLLGDGPDANQGGPLIALPEGDEEEPDAASPADKILADFIEQADRLHALETILPSVPLVKPVEHYYISSSYGRRRDPFSKRWALHSGVDMASSWKTPVMVTAPGTVTFVGRNGPYGRMVEVDHGNGFSTRYGHLTKAVVEKGATVALGDRIGLMGSTGRSTGTHLHYEIRFNDTPLNPLKFFEAAKYVQTAE